MAILKTKKRYTGIILSVAALLILSAAIFGLNYINYFQTIADERLIQRINTLGTLYERTLFEAHEVHTKTEKQEDRAGRDLGLNLLRSVLDDYDEIKFDFEFDDENLVAVLKEDVFENQKVFGVDFLGMLQDQESVEFLKSKATRQAVVAEMILLLDDMQYLVRELVNGPRKDQFYLDKTKQITDMARWVNQDFIIALNRTNEVIIAEADKRAKTIQDIGMWLVITSAVVFLFILFFFLRNLKRADRSAEVAREETGEILRTVNEGLFLLNPDMTIGGQYSTALELMFNQNELANKNLFDVLNKLVDANSLETAKGFVELLFTKRVKESLVGDLNPLDRIQVSIDKGDGTFDQRYVAFAFKRIKSRGEVIHLLVTVQDITRIIELENKLQAARQQSNSEMDMFLFLARADKKQVSEFISTAHDRLGKVNTLLEAPALHPNEYRNKIPEIYRLAHDLKGRGTALGLNHLVDSLHEMENKLEVLRNKPEIEGVDFLPITVILNHLSSEISDIEEIDSRFNELLSSMAGNHAYGMAANDVDWHSEMNQLAGQVASDLGKQVRIDYQGNVMGQLKGEQQEVMRTALIQLVRNSIVHGIEKPDLRYRSAKNRHGVISISETLEGGHLKIAIRDDGCGLDVEKIRKKARSIGRWSDDYVDNITPGQLVSLLFTSGFSTLDKTDEHGGRGVGLDVVKSALQSIGGKISVRSRSRQFTEFTVSLPLPEAA